MTRVSSVHVNDESSYRGFRTVTLENEILKLSVFPELGAKVYDLIHLPTKTNVLWHNPRIPLAKQSFGSWFDNVWSGGWDEIFPNDAESVVGGERFPVMGEIWALPWEYEIDEKKASASVETKVLCPISPVQITRKITLRRNEPTAHLEYEFSNLSGDELNFLWKPHLAFAINEECRIETDAKRGMVDSMYAGPFASNSWYRWPRAKLRNGAEVDMRVVRPDEHTCTCHYLTGFQRGEVRFVDGLNGVETEIRFPSKILNNVWLFLAYGGWRNIRSAVIEPSTSYPTDLAEAIRRGLCSHLDGGKKLSASVEISLKRTKTTKR
jgi:galactose mutarotase-like enzyme